MLHQPEALELLDETGVTGETSVQQKVLTDNRVKVSITWETRGPQGHKQMMLVNKYGFPRGYRQRQKHYFGYQTGDLVRAVVARGARKGTHVGRVAVKAKGYFTIQTKSGPVADVVHRYCTMQQRTDGYNYILGERPLPPSTNQKGAPVSSPA